MGVVKLWDVVQGSGRKVTEESLRGKRIAIDISIWLNKFIKVMHDKTERRQAHLLGIFLRCCKLLYYQARPVFVFDGGVPELKINTLVKRKRSKDISQKKFEETALQLFATRLGQFATDNDGSTPKEWIQKINKEFTDLMESQLTEDTDDIRVIPQMARNSDEEDSGSDDELDSDESLVESDEFDIDAWFYGSDKESDESEKDDIIDVDLSESQTLPASYQIPLPDVKESFPIPNSIDSSMKVEEILLNDDDEIDLDVFRSLPSEVKKQIVAQLEEKRKGTNALTPSPIIPVVGLNSFSTPKKQFTSPADVSSASPIEFSQLQLQSILNKGQTVKKITQMRDIMQNEGWRSVSSKSGEYQVFLNSQSPVNKDTIFGQGETTPLSSSQSSSKREDSGENEKKRKAIAIMFSDDEDSNSSGSDNESSEFSDSDDVPIFSMAKESKEIITESVPVKANTPETTLIESSDSDDILIDSISPNNITRNIQITQNTSISNDILESSDSDDILIDSVPQSMEVIPKQSSTFSIPIESSDSDDIITDISFSKNIESSSQPKESISKPYSIENIMIDEDNYSSSLPESTSPKSIIEKNIILDSSSDSDDEIYIIPDNITTIKTQKENNNIFSKDIEILGESKQSSSVKIPIIKPTKKPIGDGSIINLLTNTTNSSALEELSEQLEQEADHLSRVARQQTVKISSITSEMIYETQELLKLFGIPYIVSPTEAESQCAILLNLGLVDAVATEDSDIFLFGGNYIYRNLFNQKKDIEAYCIDAVEKELGLSRNMLIDYALLVGSDYTEGIKGIGTVLALEILGEFKSAESFANWFRDVKEVTKSDSSIKKKLFKMKENSKIVISAYFPEKKVIDAYLRPNVSYSKEEFTWSMPQRDELKFFMASKANWPDTKTEQHLKPVLCAVAGFLLQENESIPSNEEFYSEENKLPSKLKSKRVKSAFDNLTNTTPSVSKKRKSTTPRKTPPKKKTKLN